MNIFDTILQKIGLEKKPAPAQPISATAGATVGPVAPAAPAVVAPPAPVAPIETAAPVVSDAPVEAAPPDTIQAVLTAAPVSDAVLAALAVEAVPAMSMVDVVAKLNSLAASHPELDWKVSIVDLLKLLGMDSSFDARKNLATELGCPANLMGDSASMNVWLHKTVLQKIAENGGNIPDSLLH